MANVVTIEAEARARAGKGRRVRHGERAGCPRCRFTGRIWRPA